VSFLLDTDICSAYLKNNRTVIAKVALHFGGLHISVVTIGELLTWARRAKAAPSRVVAVYDLVEASIVHEVDI
jgi:predicted nucleic acid-binding protein